MKYEISGEDLTSINVNHFQRIITTIETEILTNENLNSQHIEFLKDLKQEILSARKSLTNSLIKVD